MSEENKEQAILDQLAAILTEDAEQVEASEEQAVAEQEESTEQAVDVEALQKENAELKAQLAEYDEQASTMLSARTTKLSEQNKKKVEDLLSVLKANSPLQRLAILNTIQGATSKGVADNARASQAAPSSKPKNLKELRGNLKKILSNSNR
jgi:transcriptional/translational regulatory protein YebC/TACO1